MDDREIEEKARVNPNEHLHGDFRELGLVKIVSRHRGKEFTKEQGFDDKNNICRENNFPRVLKTMPSSKNCAKVFNQQMTFDILNSLNDPQNMPFTVTLEIRVQDVMVTIRIPALNFIINDPAGGSVATIAGFLPKKIRPVDTVYEAFPLESELTNPPGYDLYVANDGSLRIVGKGDFPIPTGAQITHATTITYLLPKDKVKPPKNFALSVGSSRANQPDAPFPFNENQFLDWYRNAFVNDTLAWVWADNSKTKDQFPYSFSIMTRTGKLIRKEDKKPSLKLNDPVWPSKPLSNINMLEK